MPRIDKINALDSRLGQYGQLFQHHGKLITTKRDGRLSELENIEMHLIGLVMELPVGSNTALSFIEATASVEVMAESVDPSNLKGVANYYPILVTAWEHVCKLVSDPR